MKAFAIPFVFFLLATQLGAQEIYDDRIEVGVYASFSLSNHRSAVISSSGGISCCGDFSEGSGRRFSGALLIAFPVYEDIKLEGRFTICDLSTDFEEDTPFSSPDMKGGVISGLQRHHYKTKIIVSGIEALAVYNPIGGLTVALGPGIYLFAKKKYSYSQYILEPEGYTYINSGSRTSLLHEGNIEKTASPLFAGLVSLRYLIPLDRSGSFSINPELSYQRFFNSIVDDSDWKASTICLGLSLRMYL